MSQFYGSAGSHYSSGGSRPIVNGSSSDSLSTRRISRLNSSCYYNSSLVQQSNSYMEISDNAGAPMPMDQQKHHQTMMWQQNQYMGDSGIQSSVTTRVGVQH